MEKDEKKSLILFIPETGIYPYIRGLGVLGDAVAKAGSDVFLTHCTGQMIKCPMMTMHKVAEDDVKGKADLCKKCDVMFQRAQKQYKFKTIELSDFVNDDLLKKIEKYVLDNINDLENINYRDFPVGKISQYDFILETKFPFYNNLSESHRATYISFIKNTALTIAIADGICQRFKPDSIITFNEYAQCQAVRHSANANQVKRLAITYPVHFNIDASRFPIWKSTCEYWRYQHCQNWKSGKNLPIKAKDVIACWDDSIFRMYNSGTHIFSSRKKNDPGIIFSKLNLDSNKKTIVVYPSSQDERGSVEIAMKVWGEDNYLKDAFSNQIEWLEMLRDYAAKRTDVQIVVRVHPREGFRGQGFNSQHLADLKVKFTANTESFIIIWPDDPISSYDLMELADICLITWSLMGQEAARLGIPVLASTTNMFYPNDDFIQVAGSPKEYKQKLDNLVKTNSTWEHLVKAVRFYHWRIFITSLNLGETVPVDVQDDRIWPEAPADMVGVISDVINGKQDLIAYNLKQWQSSLPEDAVKQESEAMRQGIRCLLDKIYYPPVSYEEIFGILFRIYRKAKKVGGHIIGKKFVAPKKSRYPFIDYDLEFTTDASNITDLCLKTKRNKNLRILLARGLEAILIRDGKILKRLSPVVIRLAKLYNSSQLEKYD